MKKTWAPAPLRYSVAFHWALAQFHGTMELFPSTLEVGTNIKMQLFPLFRLVQFTT